MDTHELLGRITKLPIIADGLAEDMLSGSFRSVFRGQGLEFDEARHYQWGDDARNIDWNASARLGTPFIKMFREERELTVMILLDISASMHSGLGSIWNNAAWDASAQSAAAGAAATDQKLTPFEQALIAASLIAFSAERGGQRVGALLFDREINRVYPPRKGRRGVLSFVSGALQCRMQREKQSQGDDYTSNVRLAIASAQRMLKRRRMVILLSDFINTGWEKELIDISRRHDLIAIRISDPELEDLKNLGLITMEDPETGLRMSVPTGSASFRMAWQRWHRDRAEIWQNQCTRAGISHLELPVNTDAVSVLRRFFGGRSGR
jgi:uncharacterized protein (DUF58 family)